MENKNIATAGGKSAVIIIAQWLVSHKYWLWVGIWVFWLTW